MCSKKRASISWSKQIDERLKEDGIQNATDIKLLFL
ncbi:hypothetical protein B4U80_10410, partial [Leptotrombidium deliense]